MGAHVSKEGREVEGRREEHETPKHLIKISELAHVARVTKNIC